MNSNNASLGSFRSANANDVSASEIVEVSLFLSRQQIAQLAQQAQKRGMTSAQFLRKCISNVCQPGNDNG